MIETNWRWDRLGTPEGSTAVSHAFKKGTAGLIVVEDSAAISGQEGTVVGKLRPRAGGSDIILVTTYRPPVGVVPLGWNFTVSAPQTTAAPAGVYEFFFEVDAVQNPLSTLVYIWSA